MHADVDTSVPTTADAYYRRGAARLALKDYGPAIADLGEAIRMSPGTAAYYRSRSAVYRANGNARLARADLERAVALDPNDGETLMVQGYARIEDGDRAGALVDADAAAKVTPPASLKLRAAADLYERTGHAERGIPLLDAMIAVHRDDAAVSGLYNARCWARALANVELSAAADDCAHAIRIGGRTPDVVDTRGLLRFRMGDYAGAIADYDNVLNDDPKAAWSLYMRGAARIASARPMRATPIRPRPWRSIPRSPTGSRTTSSAVRASRQKVGSGFWITRCDDKPPERATASDLTQPALEHDAIR